MKQSLTQWLKCYKSYWVNLVMFILNVMVGTVFLHDTLKFIMLPSLMAIPYAIVSIIALCMAFIQYKKFNEKNQYITLLQLKSILDKEKCDQR